MDTEDAVRSLSEEECWQRLSENEFGRLAYQLVDEVGITPLNYAVDGSRIVFRSSAGSKLLGIVMHGAVALEIDDFAQETAWSVVAKGEARILEGDEARAADNLRLRPWVPSPRFTVVAIEVTEVSGRAFHLNRPWLHLRPAE